MWKILTSIILLLTFSGVSFADHWRYRNYHRQYQHRHYGYYNTGRISPWAAAGIGVGTGVLGYVIGRNTYRSNDRIECKQFDMRIIIDGEEKLAKVTKCRTEDGTWQIPE